MSWDTATVAEKLEEAQKIFEAIESTCPQLKDKLAGRRYPGHHGKHIMTVWIGPIPEWADWADALVANDFAALLRKPRAAAFFLRMLEKYCPEAITAITSAGVAWPPFDFAIPPYLDDLF